MRHFPGWVIGALSTAAVVGAFYAGGALKDTGAAAPLYASQAAPGMAAPDATGLQVECEPGQRAVVRQATALAAGSVTCTSNVMGVAPAAYQAAAPAQATPINYVSSGGYASRAVINEPVEVYRPRAVPVSYQSREASRPARSVKKSVAIIAGSTVAGATIGGLTKGKKGALVGGIVGAGAATVWDQVTRRRDNGR